MEVFCIMNSCMWHSSSVSVLSSPQSKTVSVCLARCSARETALAWHNYHKGLPWQKKQGRIIGLPALFSIWKDSAFISEQNFQRLTDTEKGLDIEAAGGISMLLVWPGRSILSKDQENRLSYWNEAPPFFSLLHRDFYLYFEILLMKIVASFGQAPQKGCFCLTSIGCLQGETWKAVDLVQVWIQRTRTASSQRGAVLSMCRVVTSMSPSICRHSL